MYMEIDGFDENIVVRQINKIDIDGSYRGFSNSTVRYLDFVI